MSYPEPSCPFCDIASIHPPKTPSTEDDNDQSGSGGDTTIQAGLNGQAHMILSTKYVLAFLDIMPLTKGHVLVVTRDHYKTLWDLDVKIGMEVS